MSKQIALTKGRMTIVDDDDFEYLSQFKWYAMQNEHGNWYAARRDHITKKIVLMHRFLLRAKLGEEIDHKNWDGLDNRKDNIRLCTRAQNQHNQPKHGGTLSQFKGVTLSRDRKRKIYNAQIRHRGANIWIGRFDNAIEAAIAYDKKAKELYGEFACINFPDKENKT